MNPHNLSKKNIKEAIRVGNYELTGILDTGEITIAIVTDLEKEVLDKLLLSPVPVKDKDKEETIKKLKKMTDSGDTEELLEVYKQLSVTDGKSFNICLKNGLRIRS